MQHLCASSPCSSYFRSVSFITWRKCFLPRDVPQRTKIQAAPLPIQLQPSRLCDVKLMPDVTQKGPETWFRAPQRFQRCSKSHCWNKPAYRNGPWGTSQSFQVEFTRTCWPLVLKRKEQNEQQKRERRDSFLLKPYFCKNRTGSFNLHSGSFAFAQFKWEMNRKWRDKPYEELPWLQWKATYQAPSTILRWTPWILVHLKQDMKDNGLLNFMLSLRRAAQGCVTEKRSSKKLPCVLHENMNSTLPGSP